MLFLCIYNVVPGKIQTLTPPPPKKFLLSGEEKYLKMP